MTKRIFTNATLIVFLACMQLTFGQSRLTGDKFTISVANFPDSFGTTYDPVFVPRGQEFFDLDSLENDGEEWGGNPVELTFDGVAEQAGGLMVNERTFQWPGKPGGIFGTQAAGIDGETEFDIIDWEIPGEIVEFSFDTVDKGWIADNPGEQSFYTILGLDWANSDPGAQPELFETGFYFYYTKDGEAIKGYETQLEGIGLLVGEHPFDPTVEEVVYIAYSRNQVNEATKVYDGGLHMTGGTTQLDESDGSWALLLGAMGVEASDQNGLRWGFLIDPPKGEAVVFENGDVDLNGTIDVADLDQLSQAVRDGTVSDALDLNDDGAVNTEDRRIWVEEINNTWFGDSDLNGEFNSGDFVIVFGAGEYEDGVAGNSTWATGDWNGDTEFDSGDFVLAFSGGGFEQGPRGAAAATVPEPQFLGVFAAFLAFLVIRAGRTR